MDPPAHAQALYKSIRKQIQEGFAGFLRTRYGLPGTARKQGFRKR